MTYPILPTLRKSLASLPSGTQAIRLISRGPLQRIPTITAKRTLVTSTLSPNYRGNNAFSGRKNIPSLIQIRYKSDDGSGSLRQWGFEDVWIYPPPFTHPTNPIICYKQFEY